MRNGLLIILALANLSAAEKPDPRHLAKYTLTIDQLTLSVLYPTINEPGKSVIVSVVLENNSDRAVQYFGSPDFPFFATVADGEGKKLFHGDIGMELPCSLLNARSSLKHDYELSRSIHDTGTYFISVSRPINERDNDNWKDLSLEHMRLNIGKPLNPFPSL